MAADVQPIKPGRLLSLDVFRGATIAAMFLVNNAGDWEHVFYPLDHAEWFGCTATDLIFPFFLFIMGVAMTFSFARRLEEPGGKAHLLPKIVKRAVILFALGLLLNLESGASLGREHLRWLGVLQRIGICYLAVSFLALWFGIRGQVAWTIGILVGYYTLMKYVPVPGFGAGDLSPAGNPSTWVDTQVLGVHAVNYLEDVNRHLDPEGVLTTLPAIATTLTGLLTGHWLRDKSRDGNEKVAGMATAGLTLFVVAALWKYDFPFSKKLWTSTYVLHTSALALWTLAACYWIIDIKKVTWWTPPFVVYGVNAITAYVGVGLMSYATIWVQWTGTDGKTVYLKYWFYDRTFGYWIPRITDLILPESWGPYVASAAYPMVVYVGLWCGLMWILYRKRIFLKV